MAVHQYRELIAWQKAMDLVVEVYRLTKLFPREEILIAERLKYIDNEQARSPMELSDEVGRIIKGLLRSLDGGP